MRERMQDLRQSVIGPIVEVENSRLEGGARNIIPLIVHVTHFYYYKKI